MRNAVVHRLLGWCVLIGLVCGCQGQSMLSWWKSRHDEEYRLLLKSIDEYARQQGLSRQQAIRQLREQADQYALAQQQRMPNSPSAPLNTQLGHKSTSGAAQASWTEPAESTQNESSLEPKSSFSPFR